MLCSRLPSRAAKPSSRSRAKSSVASPRAMSCCLKVCSAVRAFLHTGQNAAVFTRRFLQQVCVVLLQPEEGMGVAAGDVHQTAPAVHSQFGGSGGFLDEPPCLFEFGGVLLQALLIQRVAFEQIFQSCHRPAAEGDALR